MKPAKFSDLPWAVQESFLWDMDLDYCSYESSMADCIHGIQNGNQSSTNQRIIDNYYSALTSDYILSRAKSLEESSRQSLKALVDLIESL